MSEVPSDIPLTGKLIGTVVAEFCARPVNNDDSWEQCSIGHAHNSIVATDGSSAVVIGVSGGGHVATQRKEVLVEARRADLYDDPVRLDAIDRNLDPGSGEPRPMPEVQATVDRLLRTMKGLAAVSPEALVSIGKLAMAAGAPLVNLYQPEDDAQALGFTFKFPPKQGHVTLFTTWAGDIEARGVFQTAGLSERGAATTQQAELVEEKRATPRKSRKKEAEAVEVHPESPTIHLAIAEPEPDVDMDESPVVGSYRLPPLRLFDEPTGEVADAGDYAAGLLEMLRANNLTARIEQVRVGPAITQYSLSIPVGMPIKKFTALEADLALQLGVKSVRIAPIPSTRFLGVEIPNKISKTVTLLEVLRSQAFREDPNPLVVGLGQDVAGQPVTCDLAKMPHLLIAGATNSGKSIGMASILTSLVFRNTPQELRLVLIDPKRVEFNLFARLPHLACPVVTDVVEAGGVLRAVTREMERRYTLLEENGQRNIESYNRKAPASERMPYMVVAIDELADLMMRMREQVEHSITSLAQKARAVGIHLVVATQRPSVDVVTGLIKTNIPSRISFAVASQIDSRVILDQTGAESLIGKGDMLFLPISSGNDTKRIQGCYVSEEEVAQICNFWASQAQPQAQPSLVTKEESEPASTPIDEEDPLWEQVVRYVVDRGQVSTSMLQKKFSIGFQRSSRLLDQLEVKKVVGQRDGPRPRDVLIDIEELERRLEAGDL